MLVEVLDAYWSIRTIFVMNLLMEELYHEGISGIDLFRGTEQIIWDHA